MNNNLMFWVEWVKLTMEQKLDLLPHITDDGILSEIATHNKMKTTLDISVEDSFGYIDTNDLIEAWAIYLMDDDEERLLEIADKVPYKLTYAVAAKLRTRPLLRRLFSCADSVHNMQDSYDTLCKILNRLVKTPELIGHYAGSPHPCVRMATFEVIKRRLTDDGQLLDVLQSMAMTEPDDHTRERMQSLLDGLTEDHI